MLLTLLRWGKEEVATKMAADIWLMILVTCLLIGIFVTSEEGGISGIIKTCREYPVLILAALAIIACCLYRVFTPVVP
jgi:uncharacterized Tic20 family protein